MTHETTGLDESGADLLEQRIQLAEAVCELIAANHLIEVLPEIIEAAAQGIAGANLTILNGTDGVNQVMTELVGQGLAVFDTLKRSTSGAAARNGQVAVAAPADGPTT